MPCAGLCTRALWRGRQKRGKGRTEGCGRAGSKNVPASLKTLLSSETYTLNSNPDFKMLVFFKGKSIQSIQWESLYNCIGPLRAVDHHYTSLNLRIFIHKTTDHSGSKLNILLVNVPGAWVSRAYPSIHFSFVSPQSATQKHWPLASLQKALLFVCLYIHSAHQVTGMLDGIKL